jgi:hypothetical protein
MALWWVGNALLLLVVAPAVVVLLTGLLRAVRRLNRLADGALEHGVELAAELDGLPKLVETKNLTAETRSLVERYGGALLRLVGA